MTHICPHCGEDCEPEDLEVKPTAPDQCHCDPRDWCDPDHIPAICNLFLPMSEDEPDLCKTCEHLRECHL